MDGQTGSHRSLELKFIFQNKVLVLFFTLSGAHKHHQNTSENIYQCFPNKTLKYSIMCVFLEGTYIPANTADKALGVVRASQSRDHFSRDEGVTAVTACTVQTLIVCRTDVFALLLEEARLC